MDGAEIAKSARWTEAASQWSSVAILAHLRTLNVSRFRLSHKHHFFLAVRVATMYPKCPDR